MCQHQIIEENYFPGEFGANEFSLVGYMVVLMFCICQTLFYIGKAVVLDIEFCVAKGNFDLEERWVYDGSIIKK